MSVSASSKGASSELSKSKSTPVQVPPPLCGDWEREYGGGSRAEKAGVNAAIVHALSGVGSCCVVRAS